MTKRLILTRHAKSSWDDPLMPDHDRPLNPRGMRAAADLGQWLASRGYVPDQVLCSDALRTRQTWEGIAPLLQDAPGPVLVPQLYAASPETILSVLKGAIGDCVMLLGHNPGIADFAGRIVNAAPALPELQRFPTGATLVVDLPFASWSDLVMGQTAFRDFIVPRELQV